VAFRCNRRRRIWIARSVCERGAAAARSGVQLHRPCGTDRRGERLANGFLFGDREDIDAVACFVTESDCKAWLYWAQSDWDHIFPPPLPCRKGID
jgi:hypothetical protein